MKKKLGFSSSWKHVCVHISHGKASTLDPGAGKEHNHWGLRESGLRGIEEHAASPGRHTHTAPGHLALCLLNLRAPEPRPPEWGKTQSQALVQRKGKTRKLEGEAGRTRVGRRRSTDLSPCKPFRVNGKYPQPQTRQVFIYHTLPFLLLNVCYMGPMLMCSPPANLQNFNFILRLLTWKMTFLMDSVLCSDSKPICIQKKQ